MNRIPGFYEWDGDGLRPGNKSEGGLHQNLFDKHGNLRGSARFIPAEDFSSTPLVVTETVYVTAEARRDNDELIEAIALLITEVGVPFAARWWRETALPYVKSRINRRAEAGKRKTDRSATSEAERKATHVVNMPAISVAEGGRPDMARAEAQARYLAAIAARAFADDQMKMIENAHILDVEDSAGIGRAGPELSAPDQRQLIMSMVTNPSLMGEETLAQLASLLDKRAATRESPPREDTSGT